MKRVDLKTKHFLIYKFHQKYTNQFTITNLRYNENIFLYWSVCLDQNFMATLRVKCLSF